MALTKAPIVAHGLASLSIAPLAKIASATWTQIGYVKEGTVSPNFEAPTANPIRVEELSMALATKYENGSKSIELDICNVESSFLETLGCTTTTSATEDLVSIPDNDVILNKMVKFEFKAGAKALYFTNATIVWNFSGGITKTGTDTFDVHLTITPEAGLGGATYEAVGMLLGLPGTGA